MPHLRKPQLPNLCLASLTIVTGTILKAAQNILFRNSTSSELDCERIRNYVSQIPSLFVDRYVDDVLKLVNRLPKEYQSKELLSMVLHPQTRHIKKEQSHHHIISQYLRRAVFANLESLTELKCLEFWRQVNDEETTLCVQLHIHALHKLEVVDLSFNCNSTVLKSVVKNCPCLIRFQAVCAHLDKEDAKLLSNLKRLEHVWVSSINEKVVAEDIAYLVCNLPSLTFIDYVNIEEVISVLKKWHQEGKVVPPFHVRSFGDGGVNSAELDNLGSYFPYLESVRILKTAQSVISVNSLPFLKHLRVCNNDVDVPFEFKTNINANLEELSLERINSIQDVLQLKNGFQLSTLKKLKLYFCRRIDLIAIDTCFPNLETLELDNCTAIPSDTSSANDSPKGFLKLKKLVIYGLFHKPHIEYLLSGCEDLNELEIGDDTDFTFSTNNEREIFFHSYTLTDEDWMELTETNPLKNLKNLKINGGYLTRNVIQKMITSFDELEVLELIGDQWRDELRENDVQNLLEVVKPYDIKLSIREIDFALYRREAVQVVSYSIEQ